MSQPLLAHQFLAAIDLALSRGYALIMQFQFAAVTLAVVATSALIACEDGSSKSASPAASAAASAKASATAKPKATPTAALKATATATATAKPKAAGAVLDPIAGHPAPPAAADWANSKEVSVTGSTRAGCVTKVITGWFYARCASDEKGLGRLKSATVIKGEYRGQTTVTSDNVGLDEHGQPMLAYTLVTPYVKGTSLLYNLRWKEGPNLDIVVDWPADQAISPARTGVVQQAAERDEEAK